MSPSPVKISGKPLKRLIELMASATGATARGIRLDAKAKGDARLIDAQTSSDVADIQAGIKEFREGNLCSIANKALPIIEDVKNAAVDPDWMIQWLDKAQDVSDDDMQTLWAKILAGEANTKGKFSKWALHTVSMMSKDDAVNLARFASCQWNFGRDKQTIIYWMNDEMRKTLQVNERQMELLGFVKFDSLANFTLDVKSRSGSASYFGEQIVMTVSESLKLVIGNAYLTLLGEEIMSLCDAKPNQEYKKLCLSKWKELGVNYSFPGRTSN